MAWSKSREKMWERFTLNKAWTRSGLAEADKERQNGTDGDGQQEPPWKEELELARRSSDFCFEGILMRRACEAGKPGDWKNYLEVFFKDDRLSMWARVKERECYNEVELEDEGRISIAQDILRKSTDFLRRIIVPSDGPGRVT